MGKGKPAEEMGFTPPQSGTLSKALLSHPGTLVCSCCALSHVGKMAALSVEGCC